MLLEGLEGFLVVFFWFWDQRNLFVLASEAELCYQGLGGGAGSTRSGCCLRAAGWGPGSSKGLADGKCKEVGGRLQRVKVGFRFGFGSGFWFEFWVWVLVCLFGWLRLFVWVDEVLPFVVLWLWNMFVGNVYWAFFLGSRGTWLLALNKLCTSFNKLRHPSPSLFLGS